MNNLFSGQVAWKQFGGGGDGVGEWYQIELLEQHYCVFM